jgi:hypothetical protein
MSCPVCHKGTPPATGFFCAVCEMQFRLSLASFWRTINFILTEACRGDQW